MAYLCFSSIGYGIYYIASIGVNLAKKTYHIGWTTMVAAVIVVLLSYLLVPQFGIVGAGISTLVGQWASAGLLFVVSQKYYHIPYQWREVVVILSISALIIAVGTRINPGHSTGTTVLKLLCLSAFPIMTVLTGVITRQQLAFLSKRILSQ